MKAAMLLASMFIVATGALMAAVGILLLVLNASHARLDGSLIIFAISSMFWIIFVAAAAWWLYFGVRLFLRATKVELPTRTRD